MIVNQTKQLQAADLDDFIQEDSIVYVSASFCGPCKVLSPTMDELAREIHPNVKIGKIMADENDENNEWVKTVGIRNVPTLLFYQYGNIIHRVTGLKSYNELLELVKEKYGI